MAQASFPADFEAEIAFIVDDGPGRWRPPTQGYRPDIRYPDFESDTAFMVWPRFLDARGKELPDGTPIAAVSRAHMFIVNRELRRDMHRRHLDVGKVFEMVEGNRTVATGRVTAILALRDDP